MSHRSLIQPSSILLVHDRFPPDYLGGGEYVLLMLAKRLSRNGIDVKVICTGDPRLEEFEGITTKRLGCSSYAFNLRWQDILNYAEGVDLIQTFTYHGLIPSLRAGHKLGIPVVNMVLAQFGEVWREMKPFPLGYLYSWWERYLLNLRFDANVYLSDFSLVLSNRISPSITSKFVVEPGISTELYHAAAKKDYVFFSGKLESRKGIETVINCARALPNIPFKVMGWGNDALISNSSLPENLVIEKYVDLKHLANTLSQARIFLFPTKIETFGLAVVEAMASGCAVVSNSELPFAGKRLESDALDDVTAAIEELWKDPVLCAKHGKENQRRAQDYSWDNSIEKLLNVYGIVLAQKRTSNVS